MGRLIGTAHFELSFVVESKLQTAAKTAASHLELLNVVALK